MRETFVVDGTLAVHMHRAAAAHDNAVAREVLTLPRLAARLAGGFLEPAGADIVFPAIRNALATLEFCELSAIATLPGTPRAVFGTLEKAWKADIDLGARSIHGGRLADLAIIEASVREALGAAWLLPRDLRDMALRRVSHAQAIFGTISIELLPYIDPVWRPLLVALAEQMPVTWRTALSSGHDWFKGKIETQELKAPSTEITVSCADQRSEVVEALRWARELLSSGDIAADEIAIASTMPGTYDETFLVLQRDSALPIHFAHGIPALSTREGQTCAALADILTRGLDQSRVRRLIANLPITPILQLVPRDWARGISAEAGLFSIEHWATALEQARAERLDGDKAEKALLAILELIAHGPSNALEVGQQLLSGRSLALWRQALRAAPPAALAMSLARLRVPDDTDPASSIVWCSADQLQSSPREYSRLLGLSVRSWPRGDKDDPLLPHHILARGSLQPRSIVEQDRTSFTLIRGQSEHIAYSFSRRSNRGGVQTASQLWPKALEVELPRLRMPTHAFSENDRLLARSKDAASEVSVLRSRACWTAWNRPELTEFDGLLHPNDPAILAALGRSHSPTSIRLLFRDLLAFVWSQALGWSAKRMEPRPLELDQAAFGELVHEVIAVGVRALDAAGGIQKATQAERAEAISAASRQIEREWPTRRPAPPGVLWKSAVALAEAMAQHALLIDAGLTQKVRSWTELRFGGNASDLAAPWDQDAAVTIPGSDIKIHGRIDRFDLADSHVSMRITDYKTFAMPQEQAPLVLAGGRELQRVLYAIAARELLGEVSRVSARLVYLRDDALERSLDGDELGDAMQIVGEFAKAATGELLAGRTHAGPDGRDRYNRYRIALPADLDTYFETKGASLKIAQAAMQSFWNQP